MSLLMSCKVVIVIAILQKRTLRCRRLSELLWVTQPATHGTKAYDQVYLTLEAFDFFLAKFIMKCFYI
jgi:hypothetical protein